MLYWGGLGDSEVEEGLKYKVEIESGGCRFSVGVLYDILAEYLILRFVIKGCRAYGSTSYCRYICCKYRVPFSWLVWGLRT